MPKLWKATIEDHRREVRDAILEATAALVAEHGLLAVTMSRIATDTGIGRATLYRYFSGVGEILHAWHQREVAAHLDHLAEVRDRTDGDSERLTAVLEAYVELQRDRHRYQHEPHAGELSAAVHDHAQLAPAEQQLHGLLRDLLSGAVAAGAVRADLPPEQLASYCLHAANAAIESPSGTTSRRLVQVILGGLRPSS